MIETKAAVAAVAAPSAPVVLSAPIPAQIPSAQTVPTSPAPPAHFAQPAPPEQTPMLASPVAPIAKVASPKTVPPAARTTPPAVVVPAHDVTVDTTVSHNAPTPASIDTDGEEMLTVEIKNLCSVQKNGKASIRRTRAELKSLRQQLGVKLHTLKAILVRTGRGGGWAAYLRSQKVPLATADKYVAEHAASLIPPEEKLLTEELQELTGDEVRQLARKILPKVSRFLITQELTYEFLHELIWGIDVAEMSYTDLGFEIPKIGSDDAPEVDAPVAESAGPAPAAPDGAAASL